MPRTKAFSVPMRGSDGWIRVALTTLGRTSNAVLDTGAFPELCVPYSDAKSRGLIKGGEAKVYPDGDSRDCMLARPLPFRLGRRGFQARRTLAWERDGLREPADPIRFILGLEFILRFKTELDFAGRRVVFHPSTSSPEKRWRRAQVIPFQHASGQALLLSGTIGGAPGWFFWDTGAEDVTLFPSTLKTLGLRPAWGRREVANIQGHSRHAGPFPLSLALWDGGGRELALKTPRAYGWDAPEHSRALEQSVGRPLLGLMNADLCGSARLLIDPQRCLLWRQPGAKKLL